MALKSLSLVLLCAVLLLFGGTATAQTPKPKILKPCSQCHQPDEKLLRGTLGNVSEKAETFAINAGGIWNVKFNDDTTIIGWQGPLHKIPKEKEVAVAFFEKDGEIYAKSVSVKPPARVPPEKLLTVDQMADLVEKGDVLIIDSRPAPRFYEGAIPGAINIYDAEFDKHIGKLPKDRNQLIVFYCAGPTWRLSPSSASKAEKLGYKNVKIFLDGMPAWKKAGKLTIECVQCLIERVKAEIPTIIVDLRSPGEAKKEHIPGAVSIPMTEVSTAYERFPKDKRAPIVLYSHDTASAIQAFEVISIWGGFQNITVLQNGFAEWKKIGGRVESGDMPTKIVYEPKPRPGEIGIEEFKRIAESRPPDKLILDVRDTEEAESGMLIGAKNIPTQDVPKKLSEIPKDKEIIVHCNVGVRAELAYHSLKDAGYKTRFLNAVIKIDPNGRYEITKD